MKTIFCMVVFITPLLGFSQVGSNTSKIDFIPSVVYDWKTPRGKSEKNILSSTLFEGRTSHMEYLRMQGRTLIPSKKKTASRVPPNEEHLLIIKSGTLAISFNDSTWLIGPGSTALLMPAEKYSLQNPNIDSCTYYEMAYRSKLPVDQLRGRSSGGSFLRDWNTVIFKGNDKGGIRKYFEKGTAMCSRFEMHVTTLNEGLKSHDPHAHLAEEIILVIDNKTEMQIGDQLFKGGTGDVYFLGSNIFHGIHNDGEGPCMYFAFQFE